MEILLEFIRTRIFEVARRLLVTLLNISELAEIREVADVVDEATESGRYTDCGKMWSISARSCQEKVSQATAG